MAEESPDSRFKSEVMTLLGKLINKADQTANALEEVEKRVYNIETGVH